MPYNNLTAVNLLFIFRWKSIWDFFELTHWNKIKYPIVKILEVHQNQYLFLVNRFCLFNFFERFFYSKSSWFEFFFSTAHTTYLNAVLLQIPLVKSWKNSTYLFHRITMFQWFFQSSYSKRNFLESKHTHKYCRSSKRIKKVYSPTMQGFPQLTADF